MQFKDVQKCNHNHTLLYIWYEYVYKLTAAQAKCLNMLSLSYDALQDLRAQCKNPEEFMAVLQNKGINSKLLREKLATIVWPPS